MLISRDAMGSSFQDVELRSVRGKLERESSERRGPISSPST